MEMKKPLLCCPHDNRELDRIGGNGVPRSLECSCGYVWVIDKGVTVDAFCAHARASYRTAVPLTEKEFNRIKELAKKPGITQTEIAARMNRSTATISHVLKRDKYVPPRIGKSIVTDKLRDRMIALKKSKKKYSQKVIAVKLNVSESVVSTTLKKARQAGLL